MEIIVNGYSNISEVEQALAAGTSDVFFDELGIPAPDFNLGFGSANHSLQTSEMF